MNTLIGLIENIISNYIFDFIIFIKLEKTKKDRKQTLSELYNAQ